MASRMKLCAAAALLLLALGLNAAEPLGYEVVADRPTCVYRCGETATFTVKITGTNGIPVKVGKVKATLDNFGPRQIASAEWDLASTNVFTFAGRLDSPGFLRIRFSPSPVRRVAAMARRCGAWPTTPKGSSRAAQAQRILTPIGRVSGRD